MEMRVRRKDGKGKQIVPNGGSRLPNWGATLPSFPSPTFPFLSLLLPFPSLSSPSLPLEVGLLTYSYRVWGAPAEIQFSAF